MKFGAIDIGTNAARLLIGEVISDNDGSFVKKISYTRIPLRLGLDVFDKGFISDIKIDEFVKTMKAFKLIAEVFDVNDLRACATSAMREAENGKEIKKLIKKETGINIEIIPGSEEARLIFSNFATQEFKSPGSFVVIDVGGGSTEISVFKKGQKVNSKSFRVGTLRMLQGKVKSNIWKKIDEWIHKNVNNDGISMAFATGGNINKIHKMLGKKSAEPLSADELQELFGALSGLTLQERIAKFKLKPDRADVIVPACEIYLNVLNSFKTNEVFVPKIGLSDGMIHDMHQRHLRKSMSK